MTMANIKWSVILKMTNIHQLTQVLKIGDTIYGYKMMEYKRVLIYKTVGKGTQVTRMTNEEFMQLLARKNIQLDK